MLLHKCGSSSVVLAGLSLGQLSQRILPTPKKLSPMPYCPLALSKVPFASFALPPWFGKKYEAQASACWSTDVTKDANRLEHETSHHHLQQQQQHL